MTLIFNLSIFLYSTESRYEINKLIDLVRCGRLLYLLHMAKYILPAVKHTLAFLCVQVENEVCAVVCITFLISERDM